MSSEVRGPGEQLSPSGARAKRLPEENAFQRQLEKVKETDPDEKKKRKRREEETEETKRAMKEAEKLAKTKDQIAPFEIEKAMATKASLEKGAAKAAKEAAAVTPPLSEDELSETLFWEEDECALTSEIETAAAKGKAEVSAKEKKGKEEKEAEAIAGLEMEEGTAKKKEAEKGDAAIAKEVAVEAATTQALQGQLAAPPVAETQSYSQLSPQVLALFERMAGVMVVMQNSGITETTISLTSDKFASSAFFGAEIIIREYETAPLQYNVEVRGNPEAVALFQANIPLIEKSFRTGNYNFGIHRLEASISRIEEEPVRDKEKEER